VNTFSCAFSRTEQVLNRMTSASSGSSVSPGRRRGQHIGHLAESYSFIWQPNSASFSSSELGGKATSDRRSIRDFVLGLLKPLYAGRAKHVKTKDGDDVMVAWSGIRHAMHDGLPTWQEAVAAIHIDHLIGGSVVEEIRPDRRGRQDPSSTTVYSTNATFDGVPHAVKIFVRNHSDGNRYYDHVTVEKKTPAGLTGSASSGDPSSAPTLPYAGVDSTIPNPDDKSTLKSFPAVGDLVEFLSDRQIDAGPLATSVVSVDGGTVHLLVNDEPIWLDWHAMEIDSVTRRNDRGVWTLKALPRSRWIMLDLDSISTDGVPHGDNLERPGMRAFGVGSEGSVFSEDSIESGDGLPGVDREAGQGWIRVDLHKADQCLREGASSFLGSKERADTEGSTGDKASLRQPAMRQSGAFVVRDKCGQLHGYADSWKSEGRRMGKSAACEVDAGSGVGNQGASLSWGEWCQPGARIRGWSGSGQPDLLYEIVEAGINKALGPGERWITAHAPGHDKGVPILIQEHPDGTASVIGGAGGKMNHLKLRGIKPAGDYKQALGEKAAARREANRKQTEADKAAGVHGAKEDARRLLKEEVKKERQEFVRHVAEIAGWKDHEFDESKHADLSPEALEKARADHDKAMFKRAREMVGLHRKKLIADGDARAAAGLGTIPLQSDDPEQLSVADLQPMKEVTGARLGFDAKYDERSGLGADEAKAEAADALQSQPPEPEALEAKAKAKQEKADLKQQIDTELDAFKAANPDVRPPDAKILSDAQQAAALLKAEKRLKLMEAKARDASREIDKASMVESKAHILEVTDAEVEDAARKQMEDDVRTAGARSFLEALDKAGGEAKVAGHIGTGAYNALNAFSQVVGGDALIDRSVVDVLGIAGAAAVLARRVATDMGGEADKVREAMEAYHLEHHEKRQAEAVEQAQALHEAAGGIELPEAETGFDLLAAQEANHKRRDAVAEAQRVLGQANGEMQANAALVAALQGKKTDKIEVNLGTLAPVGTTQGISAELASAMSDTWSTLSSPGAVRWGDIDLPHEIETRGSGFKHQ
jgi:hypothetical protein